MKIKTRHTVIGRQRNRAGAMIPLMAVTMTFLFVAAVIAVDVSRIHTVRSELRTATDAAARAAVETLGRTDSESDAVQAALDIAQLNLVAGQPLELDPSKIIFGAAVLQENGSFSFINKADFDPTDPSVIVNSVSVLGERTDTSPGGHVNMIFGGVLGVDSFEPIQSATAARLDRDIALVLDRSGSMDDDDRFAALLDGVDVFVQELLDSLPEERVSVTVYDEHPDKLLEITDNIGSVLTALEDVEIGSGTAIGRGMRVGLDSVLNDPESSDMTMKSMVVMTDGNHNTGVEPMVVAEECRLAGVVVHTITFSDEADQSAMEEVATHTGGTHLHAENDDDLIDAFRKIARQLKVLLIE